MVRSYGLLTTNHRLFVLFRCGQEIPTSGKLVLGFNR